MTVPAYARQYFDCVYNQPWNPVVIRRLFTSALQTHWSEPDHHLNTIGSGELGCMRYSDDPDRDQVSPADLLHVQPLHTFDEDQPYQGVYVGAGAMRFRKLALGNFIGVSQDRAEHSYSMMASVPIQIKHIHRTADTVLLMASSTIVFLHALRDHLAQHPHFMSLDPQAADQPLQVKDLGERYFEVAIMWDFVFNHNVSVLLESHRLKKYGTELSAEHP